MRVNAAGCDQLPIQSVLAPCVLCVQGVAAGTLECAVKPLSPGLQPSDITILAADEQVRQRLRVDLLCFHSLGIPRACVRVPSLSCRALLVLPPSYTSIHGIHLIAMYGPCHAFGMNLPYKAHAMFSPGMRVYMHVPRQGVHRLVDA